MRIESGVIGMESARRYQSSRIQNNRFVLKDYSKERTSNNTYLSKENAEMDEPQDEVTG